MSRPALITRSDLQATLTLTLVERDKEENLVGFVYVSDLVSSWVTKYFGVTGIDGSIGATVTNFHRERTLIRDAEGVDDRVFGHVLK